ncbi:MAG: hypothetical protein HY039_12125 [Nitrospirae bacterium]|nr:hypothetical protein [Nitrospirota bacterium]
MKLGILVNTDKHLQDVVGLTNAAVSKGHEVIIFAMDEGTRLVEDPSYTGLSKLPGVSMSVCDYSALEYHVKIEAIPETIKCGSQFNNAVMNKEADRIVIL